MKKSFLMFVIAGAMLSSCGEKKSEGGADSNSTEVKSDENKEITLKEYKGEKLGFTIQAPENAKELSNTDMLWTYSLVLDPMNEINVAVVKAPGELATIDDAVKFTVFGEEPKIKDKKAIGADYLVVKEPQGTLLQETWYFAKAKEGYVVAKVTTPPSQAELASKIATTLKAN